MLHGKSAQSFQIQLNLTFTPFFKRIAKTDAKLVRSEVHQLVGYFNGKITLPDQSTLQIRQMLGCIGRT